MAGIYLHIPFCRQACHYCNFHFSTQLRHQDDLVDALVREMESRADYLDHAPLSTIYLGGGTPSLLNRQALEKIFEAVFRLHTVTPGAEITLEGNPDDLSAEYLRDLRTYTPVNRLSIGIQSFFEEDLVWMHRAHNARQAEACLEEAQIAGFENLTVDLIYGAPTTTDAHWLENLDRVARSGVPHLSCYALTVEQGTALAHFIHQKKSPPVEEEQAARQFALLLEFADRHGYRQYEISNFAKTGWEARHNSSYWTGAPYLGIGPSAHSFDGRERRWNVANNALYTKSLEAGGVYWESEVLTAEDKFNEYVMTGLRTSEGCRIDRLEQLGATFAQTFRQQAERFRQTGLLEEAQGAWRLTKAGRFLADGIAADLFV